MLPALTLTGCVSARLGGASEARAAARVVAGGALAMAIACVVGRLVGAVL